MENQHNLIIGYRDLSLEEIAIMNEIKDMANEVGLLVKKIQASSGVDPRWAAMGKSDLQKGFMFLTRSVAKPASF